MNEPVVADTTCLIALARIGQLDLLQRLFFSVIIPPEVAREFSTPPEWLTVKSCSQVDVLATLKSQVDEGEAAAIALAFELNLKVILDDKAGRQAAKQLGLSVLGTIGLLVKAKNRGLVRTVRPLVDDLESHGFYMTEAWNRKSSASPMSRLWTLHMRFVFSKLFYLLFALGLILLSLSWGRPWLRWIALAYDVFLIILAVIDSRRSKLPETVRITREFSGRFAVGAETDVHINIQNSGARTLWLTVKDEYPPQMKLSGLREANLQVDAQSSMALVYGLTSPRRGRFEFGQTAVRFLSRWNLVWVETRVGADTAVKVYPNMRRAREAELKALGARSLVSSHRKTSWRGEGREFESMRDYVRGDELRHISWTATARRGKLTTRQYQIERDQTILIAIDGGRLMTARIEQETKLDSAVHAALALMSAAARAGDNAGLLVFDRKIKSFLPPSRGREHMDAALEALYSVEPEMVEPSYSRAFEFVAANSKRRSLVVLLTDLVDEEGSKELLTSLKLLRPRHLPLVVTIADRDLKAVVSEAPTNARELFTQSVAEEIMYLREAALRRVESQGGLALDVTAAALAPAILEKYLQVKERGLL